jgi:hypothetical protein
VLSFMSAMILRRKGNIVATVYRHDEICHSSFERSIELLAPI